MSDAVVMRDVIVVGGGCYGTFYATQLAKAKQRGKARYRNVVVVDRDPGCRAVQELGDAPDREFVGRDWSAFFDDFLGSSPRAVSGAPQDFIVPSPLMPHLMFEWVVRRARARWPDRSVSVGPVPGTLGTPYDRVAPDHTRYVSFADWICPTHCIEPVTCPAIAAPRTWEMSTAIGQLVERLQAQGEPVAGSALFVCRHHVFGVGTFGVEAVLAGDAVVAAAGATNDTAAVLVGTVSACHGAMNLLTIGRSSTVLSPEHRRTTLIRARDLFNGGAYWEAHEALETVWRSIISAEAALVWQGLIQAAAALLHHRRGNRHGVEVVGGGALEKLAGPGRPDVEFETETFRAQLARALKGEGDPPRLEFRADDRA